MQLFLKRLCSLFQCIERSFIYKGTDFVTDSTTTSSINQRSPIEAHPLARGGPRNFVADTKVEDMNRCFKCIKLLERTYNGQWLNN